MKLEESEVLRSIDMYIQTKILSFLPTSRRTNLPEMQGKVLRPLRIILRMFVESLIS